MHKMGVPWEFDLHLKSARESVRRQALNGLIRVQDRAGTVQSGRKGEKMITITRGQLGNILSANMATRTMHMLYSQSEIEISDEWEVVFLETDKNGVLNIYCEAPAIQRPDRATGNEWQKETL